VARVTSIVSAVKRGVRKARLKTPVGLSVVNSSVHHAAAIVLGGGRYVRVHNFVVTTRTNQANAQVYVKRAGKDATYRISGGTIEELIQSTVMAVALGVYDVDN
jgi:predicted TIM-barrel enzyme